MQKLAQRITDSVADGSKVTVENASIIGKAAALAHYNGNLTITATSPGHTTYIASR